MPDYRFRSQRPHAEVQEQVRAAAIESNVGLARVSAAGQFIWVQVSHRSDVFLDRLRELALEGVVVDASEADTPWGEPHS